VIPVWPSGIYATPDELEVADDPWAVLEDDRLVLLETYMRVGGGGADIYNPPPIVSWSWSHERPGPSGLYALLTELPAAITEEVERRRIAGRRVTRWAGYAVTLGPQIVYGLLDGDSELFDEMKQAGLQRWLAEWEV
jgi:hypothetical protein